MPMVGKLSAKIPQRKDKKVLVGLPLTWETLCLVDGLKDRVDLTVIPLTSGANSSLQPGVFRYLDKWKVKYFKEATEQSRIKALKTHPDFIVDCTFALGETALKHNLLLPSTFVIEDTRSGGTKLREYLARGQFTNSFYVLDDSPFKKNFENRFGIGYSVIASIAYLGIFIKYKKVVVVGFGPVGQGLAEFAAGLGGEVSVVEIQENLRQLATKRGFKVGLLEEVVPEADIIVTATGIDNVITHDLLLATKSGVYLANAGADFGEWDQNFLHSCPFELILPLVKEFSLPNGKKVLELGGGNSLNLASGIAVSTFLDSTFALGAAVLGQVLQVPQRTGELMMEERTVRLLNDLMKETHGFSLD